MRIKVKIGAPLSQSIGQSQLDIELAEGATVQDALAQLSARYPHFEATLAGDSSQPAIPFHFFVNRSWVRDEELARRRLKEGDRLYILAPVVGG
jgi:molybdopterin converting factor small subunit